MNNSFGINKFGSLTLNNGYHLNFDTLDNNKDGKISAEEFSFAVEKNGLDIVEFSKTEKNEDKTVTEDEFAIIEQKSIMEDIVNSYINKLSVEMIGTNSQYILSIISDLREYMADFVASYNGDTSSMAEEFRENLEVRYERLVSQYQNSDIDVGDIIDNIIEQYCSYATDNEKQRVGELLEQQAQILLNQDIENSYYNTQTLYEALSQAVSRSSYDCLINEINDFNNKTTELGGYIDSEDFEALKSNTRDLLTAALTKGVPIEINGIVVNSMDSLETFLAAYSNPTELKNDIEQFIRKMSLERNNLRDYAYETADKIAEETEEAKKAEDEKNVNEILKNIPASEYLVNAGDAHTELQLRETFQSQLTQILESNGVSFEKIESIFNHIFDETLVEIGYNEANYTYLEASVLREITVTFNNKFIEAMNELYGNTTETSSETVGDNSPSSLPETPDNINSGQNTEEQKSLDNTRSDAEETLNNAKTEYFIKSIKTYGKDLKFQIFNLAFNSSKREVMASISDFTTTVDNVMFEFDKKFSSKIQKLVKEEEENEKD